ncbi:hypothetical protein BJV82DRAFT_601729 [Fennellomyces sp. T-0311]|nr:hypothetical protein BJV82DRAFT_601729 [Fennellomyces sp. T-0311]
MNKCPQRQAMSAGNNGLLLYDRARNDMFQKDDSQVKRVRSLFERDEEQEEERSVAVRQPSITAIMLLQCQVSLIQAITALPAKRKPTTDFVKLTVSSGQQALRWSMLCGLFVLDNVSRMLGVENEMISLDDESTIFVDGQVNGDPSSYPSHSPSPPPVPALSSPATTSRPSSVCSSPQQPVLPEPRQSSSTPPSPSRRSPTPVILSRLPVRTRKISLPLDTPPRSHVRSLSNNMTMPSHHIHQQPSLRRSSGRRDLTAMRGSSSAMRPGSSASEGELAPQVHYHHHQHYHKQDSPVTKKAVPWKS